MWLCVCVQVCFHAFNGVNKVMLVMLFPPCCILTLCYVSVFFPTLSSHGLFVCACVRACDAYACVWGALCMCPSTSAPARLFNLGRGNHYAYYAYRHHEGKERPFNAHNSVWYNDWWGSRQWPPALYPWHWPSHHRSQFQIVFFFFKFYIDVLVWWPSGLSNILIRVSMY